MTFVKKQNAGLLKSVRSWGVLGLVLALAVVTSYGEPLPSCPPVTSCPPFSNSGTGQNATSMGWQNVNPSTGTASLFENGGIIMMGQQPGERWVWFASNQVPVGNNTSPLGALIYVAGTIRGSINKLGGVVVAEVTIYAFVQVLDSSNIIVGQMGGVVWQRNSHGNFGGSLNLPVPFAKTFNVTTGILPPGPKTARVYVEVRAKVQKWSGMGNGWVRVNLLQLTNVNFFWT